MQTRNEYRKEQWRQIIQECQESGLSNKAYCELHGISEKEASVECVGRKIRYGQQSIL